MSTSAAAGRDSGDSRRYALYPHVRICAGATRRRHNLEPEPASGYTALVVRVQPATDGQWYIYVDGTKRVDPILLLPLTLVVRLWRAADTGLLRGRIQLHGSDQWVPIQSNTQLEDLLRAWLFGGTSGTRS